MNMAAKPSIKKRVTVSILPSSSAKEEVELDYRLLVAGDFSKSQAGKHQDGPDLKSRKVRVIKNKAGFQEVLQDLSPRVKFSVANKISGKEDEQFDVDLEIKSMKDFNPDQIVEKIPPVQKLWQAREGLKALKLAAVDPEINGLFGKLFSLPQPEREAAVDDLLKKLASGAEEKKEG
jgi:type VI secretion system protein ImpB